MKNTILVKYARFIKIEHTLFSLPLIYAGAFLAADGTPTWHENLWILIAAASVRAVAMGLNRLIDRKIDAHNPRTQGRALPAGALSVSQVLAMILIGSAIYLYAARELNPLCFLLAPFPLAIFVIYPYLKRYTEWAHLGIGLALSLGPLAGGFAVRGDFYNLTPVYLLAIFAFLWVSGFDIIYATLDEEFDRFFKLMSLPVLRCKRLALRSPMLFHSLAFLTLVVLHAYSFYYAASWIPLFFLGLIGVLFIWEHAVAPYNVYLAFFKINAVIGLMVFLWVWVGVSI